MAVSVDTNSDTVTISTNGFAFKKATDMVTDQINYITTHTDYLNDFTEGSITRTLIEAESIEIEKLYYYTLENLQEAIVDGLTSAFGFAKQNATTAYGDVTITLNAPLANASIINRGTKFYSSNSAYEQVYVTKNDYTIPKGTQTFTVPVYCTVQGSYGNIPANVIDSSTDVGSYASVTNNQAFTTGQDEETTDQEQVRFRKMIQAIAKGTNQSLVYAAESVPNIAGVYEYEETYGSVILFCHDANGNLSDELAQQVAKAVEPYRPAGIRVTVMPTHKTNLALSIGVQVNYETLQTDDFLTMVSATIQNYINQFTAGENIYISDIEQQVMDISDTGIADTKVNITAYPDDTMLQYETISDDSITNVKGTMINHPYLQPVDITASDTYGEIGLKRDRKDFASSNGNNWEQAISLNADGTKTIDRGVEIVDVYRTNPNELLRVGNINVQFYEANELLDTTDIRRTEVEYQTANSKTVRPDGDWSSDYVQTTDDKPYLWTKTTIYYVNGNTKVLYSVVDEG